MLDLPDIDEVQKQVIDGILLSDGYISKQSGNKNCILKIKQKPSRKQYLDHVFQLLHPYGSAIRLSKSSKIESVQYVNGKRTLLHSKTEFCFYNEFCSKSHKALTDLRHKWYPKGIKIVPKDLNISPIMLAHWYMGDGSHMDKPRQIYFSTDNFTNEDVDFLSSLINSLGFKTFLCQHYGKPRIYISAKFFTNFMDMISDHICECMQYKIFKEDSTNGISR